VRPFDVLTHPASRKHRRGSFLGGVMIELLLSRPPPGRRANPRKRRASRHPDPVTVGHRPDETLRRIIARLPCPSRNPSRRGVRMFFGQRSRRHPGRILDCPAVRAAPTTAPGVPAAADGTPAMTATEQRGATIACHLYAGRVSVTARRADRQGVAAALLDRAPRCCL